MSYVISSRHLKVDYRQEHIHALLDLYLKGADISNSPVVEWGFRTLQKGWWFYGIEELPPEQWRDAILERQKQIIALYEDIRENGYNGSVISVYFDKVTGEVNVYDGYHRLSIIKYLGREYNMNCKVSYHHPTDENMRGDFPLTKRLLELNGNMTLYQPIDDKRVEGWSLWRPDSKQRLDVILSQMLEEGSVLDVGCETGYFSRELAKRGFTVTAVDKDPRRLAVARYLSRIKNLDIQLLEGTLQTAIKERTYTYVLLLSVLHHDVLALGLEEAVKGLEALRGRCDYLVIEFPLQSRLVKWLPAEQKNSWSLTLEQWLHMLESHTGMAVIDVQYAKLKDRPIVTLESVI